MQQTQITITIPGNIEAQLTQTVVDIPDSSPPPVQQISTKISLLDFGAKGDGTTDDGPAIQTAITKAAEQGFTVFMPPLHYRIATPVHVQVPSTANNKWGMVGNGSIQSALVNGENVLTIESTSGYVRNMTLGGFGLRGSGNEGAGLVLRCTGGGWSQNFVYDTMFENLGGDGFVIEGEFFETKFISNNFMDCHNGNGVVAANLAGGKNISSLRFWGLNVAQCGGYGFLATGRDNSFNAPQDCHLTDGYIRQCGKGGARFYLGGYLVGMMFENNCVSSGDSHIQSSGPTWAMQCRGDMSMATAKATYLFSLDSSSGNHAANIRDCVVRDNGWIGTPKLAKLSGKHFTTIVDCEGDIDGVGGGCARTINGKVTITTA